MGYLTHGWVDDLPTNEMPAVFRAIGRERRRQIAKWGPQHHHAMSKWLTILGEEFGEACKAALECSDTDFRIEVLQVAAVAVAMLEAIEHHERMADMTPEQRQRQAEFDRARRTPDAIRRDLVALEALEREAT